MKPMLAAVLLAAAAPAWPAGGTSVVGSKHDLSVTGPGPIRATTERNVCIFCHISHGAAGEHLGNRPDAAPNHVAYESSTMSARAGRPTGASRVCLSCHDGTIAVGRTLRREIRMNVTTIPQGRRSNLGTDLRGSHPISFRPAPVGRAREPAPGPVRLDGRGEIQCTSCHDPHAEWATPDEGKFLVKGSRRSELCLTCHDGTAAQGPASAHAASTAAFGAAQGNEAGFSSVGEAGCAACHASHGGDPGGRLVRRPRGDDDAACMRCHDGAVARAAIGRDATKPYAHDGSRSKGVHDAGEGRGGPRPLPETSPGAARHVACVDCHEPHLASGLPAVAPDAPGALAGVWGVDQHGQRVEQVQFEYEVCFKCHADSANQPQASGPRPPETARRATVDANLRRVFATSAWSSHPVVAPSRNPDVPSLRAPYTASSMIYCTDCHASDTGPGAGGMGARGPHGSIFPHLLERNYSTADRTAESPSSYALCYKCHDRDRLLSDLEAERGNSAFRQVKGAAVRSLHRLHVVANSASCATCHSAHGVSQQAGRPDENTHLVDFDVSVVRPAPGVPISFRDLGSRRGSCSLTCHGVTHSSPSFDY